MPIIPRITCASCGGPQLLLELRPLGLCPACVACRSTRDEAESVLARANWSIVHATSLGIPGAEAATTTVDSIPCELGWIECFGVVVYGIPWDWPGPHIRYHAPDGHCTEALYYERFLVAPDREWVLRHRCRQSDLDMPEHWDWWTEARGWVNVSVKLDPLKGDERKTANRALKALTHHQETRGGRRSVGGYADGWEALRAVTDAISRYPGIPRQQDVADRLWADDLGKDDKAIRRLFDNLITPTTGKTWDDVKHGG